MRSLYDINGRFSRRQSYRGMNGVVPDRVIDRDYHYDTLNRLVTKRHSLQQQTVYCYDERGRITGCLNEAYSEAMQYDAAANLVEPDRTRAELTRGTLPHHERALTHPLDFHPLSTYVKSKEKHSIPARSPPAISPVKIPLELFKAHDRQTFYWCYAVSYPY